MKLVFSEAGADYARYLYPYVIWAVPEAGETPADLFAAGFLPGVPTLERFYLCRHLRVPLAGFEPNSENRRILRRGGNVVFRLIPRVAFEYTEERRSRWLAFAEERFGAGVMPGERLDKLMRSPVISDLLVFTEAATQRELGVVLLYREAPRMAFYYYAFYDLAGRDRNLGMFLMTQAVQWFAEQGLGHLYLGTCYSERALYKTQFDGVQYFNGWAWSDQLGALKAAVRGEPPGAHRLADPGFLERAGGLPAITALSGFRGTSPGG